MTSRHLMFLVSGVVLTAAYPASAQTSSLSARKIKADVGKVVEIAPREAPRVERNPVYDRYSWVSLPARPVKMYAIGDLVTVIVREQRQFKADSDLETSKDFNVDSALDAFIKVTGGGIGDSDFRRGKPTIKYKLGTEYESEGDTKRKDAMTLRLTGQIIDVKPNGVLVLEAKARIQHDDEISTISLTGSCRKEDVTADNTILSTQLANKYVTVNNEGALRISNTRGWIPRVLDLLNPF